jgi:hypothetical protein
MHILPLKILCSQICIVFLFSFSIINYLMYSFPKNLSMDVKKFVLVFVVALLHNESRRDETIACKA